MNKRGAPPKKPADRHSVRQMIPLKPSQKSRLVRDARAWAKDYEIPPGKAVAPYVRFLMFGVEPGEG